MALYQSIQDINISEVLFIITGSIAVSKCFEILDELKKNKVKVSCIITNNAKSY